MPNRQPPLPSVWALTDARNDARLETVLSRLPRGSGVIFRHYHLDAPAREARLRQIARLARRLGTVVALSGAPREARRLGAAGAYKASGRLTSEPTLLRLLTAHSLREIGLAARARADAILLSPVFATRNS